MIKVLLVEDDEDFAFLMKKLLSRQPDIQIVGYCGDEDTVMEMVRREIPDVVLMDLNLGNSSADGIRLSRQIRIETDAKVLILTALNTPDIIMRAAREAFASGYIFKNQLSFLVENIRAISKEYTAQEYLIASSALSILSDAEMAVFQIMMGKENDFHSSAKTLSNQKGRIIKKLGLKNQKELVHVFKMFFIGDQKG
ncbi:MAG TPA: response regulator transcription factor [Candidatus Scybalocola faecigallinarum]|uniref:Stage 0 sporulation protein A homolog n=1 Tax=Candidatus Scybalocola faecigallinarum TaxID=2840941 RepID=A0A9D1F3P6_9FIRM|nr:response regulator transcription factor [Candidatus Scybalocola faecigallinarum]